MQSRLLTHSVEAGPDSPGPKPAPCLSPLLYSARDLAVVLRISVPTVWRLRAAGKLPRPLDALGAQLLRWDAGEIKRWVAAGMPSLDVWQELKQV